MIKRKTKLSESEDDEIDLLVGEEEIKVPRLKKISHCVENTEDCADDIIEGGLEDDTDQDADDEV